MDYPQPFGRWLRHRRKELDITQEQLSGCVGCAPATIRMIENGQRRPSRQVAELLARCLHIPELEQESFLAHARASHTTSFAERDPYSGSGALGPTSSLARPVVLTPLSTNLPTQRISLLGRDSEIQALLNLLFHNDSRLLTLTGPPGIGKTSLALRVASSLLEISRTSLSNRSWSSAIHGGASANPLDEYPFSDGIYWVPLASLSDPSMVIPSIARVLDVQGIGTQSSLDALVQALKPKRMLLLLDNFEQVIDAGTYVAQILAPCPHLKVLVTSREPLGVREEREFTVSSLPLPDPSVTISIPDLPARSPAVALFVERAQAVDRHFELTLDNAPVIAAICARLDGLPLAIELVAARTKVLPLRALLARLQDTQAQSRLDLLAGGARDTVDRHKTLRNAIGWSYSLLDDQERILFRRLGVFRGGFTLGAAEAICNAGADLKIDMFEGIAQLLHKSMLKRDTLQGGDEPADEVRFTMLETIREYAVERLREGGEEARLLLLHSEYFLAIASRIPLATFGEDEVQIYNSLDKEYDNLRAALLWAIENNKLGMAAQFGISLSRYWHLRGHFREGHGLASRIISVLAGPAGSDSGLAQKRVGLLQFAAIMSLYMSDYASARSMLEESLSVARDLGIERLARESRIQLGNVARMQGQYIEAESQYRDCIEASQDPGQEMFLANSLWALGTTLCELGDLDGAEACLMQSLALAKSLGDKYVTSGSMRDLGVMLSYRGKHEEAIRSLEESLALARQANFQFSTGWILSALGFAALGAGDHARAEACFLESLQLGRSTVRHRLADNLEGLAAVGLARTHLKVAHAQAHRSATLAGAAANVRRLLGINISPARAASHDHLLADIRSRLSENEYEQASSRGQSMGLEEAVSYALTP